MRPQATRVCGAFFFFAQRSKEEEKEEGEVLEKARKIEAALKRRRLAEKSAFSRSKVFSPYFPRLCDVFFFADSTLFLPLWCTV
jgi:hypothetical protein